jgi:hypothetical protein
MSKFDRNLTGESCIAVVRVKDSWRIVTSKGCWGRFLYRVDAEEAALRLADDARRDGGPAPQVLVQHRAGELTAIDSGLNARALEQD